MVFGITIGKRKSIAGSLAVIALLLAVFISMRSVQAAPSCSLTGLTDAVTAGGTFDFNCATDTTITLSATLTIATDLSLTNTGAGKVTISGANTYQLFAVNSSKSCPSPIST
ncbi:hypothetical protein [Candidatus Chlorohelix sp.]|uniref:hypothetical protein n=1 Tax=Candidatus Chlorohelix sp. TaxID=3139201 RepID=UPI003021B4B5